MVPTVESSGHLHLGSDDTGRFADPPPNRTHSIFQDSATPERNRFFVRRNPSGEMEIVNGSPLISISRRIGLSSFVAMVPLETHGDAPCYKGIHACKRMVQPVLVLAACLPPSP